jgi:putative Holliday junction resolvase
VRIGVAACDPAGVLAFPLATVPAGPDELATLVRLVIEHAPLEVVVGLPRSLSGSDGPAAVGVRAKAAGLAAALGSPAPGTPVRLVDERLTTVTATRQLRERGLRAREQRSRVDAVAAAAILQHALDAERTRSAPPGELVSAADAAKETP